MNNRIAQYDLLLPYFNDSTENKGFIFIVQYN